MPLYRKLEVKVVDWPIKRGWIRIPFNVNPLDLALEFRNATNPVWPPTDIVQADQLAQDFAVWCSQDKGYDVYFDDVLEVG